MPSKATAKEAKEWLGEQVGSIADDLSMGFSSRDEVERHLSAFRKIFPEELESWSEKTGVKLKDLRQR